MRRQAQRQMDDLQAFQVALHFTKVQGHKSARSADWETDASARTMQRCAATGEESASACRSQAVA